MTRSTEVPSRYPLSPRTSLVAQQAYPTLLLQLRAYFVPSSPDIVSFLFRAAHRNGNLTSDSSGAGTVLQDLAEWGRFESFSGVPHAHGGAVETFRLEFHRLGLANLLKDLKQFHVFHACAPHCRTEPLELTGSVRLTPCLGWSLHRPWPDALPSRLLSSDGQERTGLRFKVARQTDD